MKFHAPQIDLARAEEAAALVRSSGDRGAEASGQLLVAETCVLTQQHTEAISLPHPVHSASKK